MKTRALLLALPLVVLACRDQNSSLQIQAICTPTDDCTFADQCDAQYIGFPTVDVALGETLWLLLQVENQTEDNADAGTGRVNTNDAHIDELVVEYDGPAIPRQVSNSNYYVPADGSAVVSVMAIPPGYLAALTAVAGQQITTRIRMRGYWDDGSRFETAEFPVAVKICSGCNTSCGALPTCPPDSDGQLPVLCMDPGGAGTT